MENDSTPPNLKQDDLIDFKCSPTFLDFYHAQGLTPRHSGRVTPRFPSAHEIVQAFKEHPAQPDGHAHEELVSLRTQFHAMGQQLRALQAQTAKLVQQLQRRNSVHPAARNEMAYRGIDPDVIAEH